MRKAPPLVLFALFALSQSTESAYTTSMPQMAFSLNATHSEIQATSSIYFYGFAFGIFCLGGLSDIIGRKKVVLIGLGLFFIANLLIFWATNIHQLTILRFIQAFGASVGSVGAQAIARDVYKGPELSKLYASLAAGIAIVPSISSFIAGNILQYFGWREVFCYLMGISLLLLIICTIFLQETYDFQKNKTYPDYKGVL
ncbi:MAG: MFS transporter, partial [Alphaproteobacteria bacterium]|nr:MFS transporter [Alphaproteobacteria bacterium]